MPALAGVIDDVDADATIEAVLRSGSDGYRFRQTVGVAVKLKMARLGWRTAPKVLSVLYALIIPAHRDRTTALMEDLQRLGTVASQSRIPA